MKIGLELATLDESATRLCVRVDVTKEDEEELRLQGRIPEAVIGESLDTIRPACPYLQCTIGVTFSQHVTDELVARISCERDEYKCRPGFGDVTTIQACGHLATVFSEYGLADESALK